LRHLGLVPPPGFFAYTVSMRYLSSPPTPPFPARPLPRVRSWSPGRDSKTRSFVFFPSHLFRLTSVFPRLPQFICSCSFLLKPPCIPFLWPTVRSHMTVPDPDLSQAVDFLACREWICLPFLSAQVSICPPTRGASFKPFFLPRSEFSHPWSAPLASCLLSPAHRIPPLVINRLSMMRPPLPSPKMLLSKSVKDA